MDLFPFSDDNVDEPTIPTYAPVQLNQILYDCDLILGTDTYYLDCLYFLFKKNIDYENEVNFDSIRLIRNIYSLYPELSLDDISSVIHEIYLFRTNLDNFFDIVRIERKKIMIDIILDMVRFLGDLCPYDGCDNFIIGERERCDVCNREIRIDTDCDEFRPIDLSCSYYLEGMLYYERV